MIVCQVPEFVVCRKPTMTSKRKIIFLSMLFSQLVLLLVYLAERKHWLEKINTSLNEHGNLEDFQENLIFQATKSIRQVTDVFLAATRASPRPTTPTTITADEEYKHSERSKGSSNLQKQKSVNETATRLPQEEYFQTVDDKEAWFYSAFYDYVAAGQGHPSVRLIGVANKRFLVQAFCNYSLVDGTNLETNAKIKPMPESHNKSFSPAYLACPLPRNVLPTHVSISFSKNKTPTNRLLVQYPGPRIRNFTVCFSVLHSNYSTTTQFIQSMEMNQILGAEHFMIYVNNISTQLEKIIRLYEDDGILTIKQWSLPTDKAHYFSQVAALNDCVYRNRNTSRFVVVVDTDELIIPRNNNNWMELINNISPQEVDVYYFMNSSVPPKSRTSYKGCFMVRSSFFATNSNPDWDNLPKQYYFDDNERKNILKYDILALSQFLRGKHIFKIGDRTKYIVRPEVVENTGIHDVHYFVRPMKCESVNESMALIHHYRKFSLIKDIVNDTSILKYKHLLYPRVMHQLKRFSSIIT